jgi:uncharacterized protein YegL
MGSSVTKLLAAAVAVLVVTGTIAPAVAGGGLGDEATQSVGSDAGSSAMAELSNATALDRKHAAITTVSSMAVDRKKAEKRQQRVLDRLNGTLSEYRDGVRVTNESVFHDDAWALQQLSQLSDADAGAVENASRLVVTADLETANTSIAEAERALALTEGRVDSAGQHKSAEQAVENAKRAREKASDALSGDATAKDRARALKHLATAWRQSQHALDVLDAATSPMVVIETRADPPRNGSVPLDRTFSGRVLDVRPYELENATLSVNGEQHSTLSLNATTAAFGNATFEANVTIGPRVATVNVTVVDGADATTDDSPDDEKKGNGKKGDKKKGSGDDEADSTAPQVGSDTLALDGDGLPDEYERSVTGTDPLDHDSDSSETDADEGADGTSDGATDFDGDEFVTYHEYRYGTDPFDADTDGDGLTDLFELKSTQTNPTVADSDDDGVPDAAEDHDDDGLNATAEQSAWTNARDADTDGDGLNDGDELDLSTDPKDRDTDDDGLSDGDEIELGTDPLVADTDGDGVLDGDETFTVSETDESTGVSVSVTGSSSVNGNVSVSQVEQNQSPDFRKAPVVRIQSGAEFESANVSVPLPENVSDAEAENLTILKWSPETDDVWRPVNTTLDRENGTATATVDGFSYFTLVNVNGFVEAVTFGPSAGGGGGGDSGPVDAMMVIDTSGSMYGSKIAGAKTASKRFVGALEGSDKGGLVGFASYSTLHQSLTQDYDDINDSIDGLYAGGGTNIGSGIDEALTELEQNGDAENQVIVLLSDGVTSYEGYALDQADEAKENGVEIITVAFGNYADEELLKEIASRTNGTFFKAGDSDELSDTFEEIGDDVTDNDFDGDGLPNSVENASYLLPMGPNLGERVSTDPFDNDTDGDGLSDGEEVTLVDADSLWEFQATDEYAVLPASDPSKNNSDEAGLSDPRELERGSNPFVPERFLFSFQIPNRVDRNDQDEFDESTNGNRLAVTADKFYYYDGKLEGNDVPDFVPIFGEAGETDRPSWLEGVDLEDGKTYYMIPAMIQMEVDGASAESIYAQIELEGARSDVELVQPAAIDVSEGTTRTNLVLETADEKDEENDDQMFENPNSGNSLIDIGRIGKLHVSFYFSDDSIFYRTDVESSTLYRYNEQVNLRSETYDYQDFGTSQADRLVSETAEELKNAVVDMQIIYGGAYGYALQVPWTAGKFVTYRAVKEGERRIKNRIKEGTFNGDVRLEKSGGEVYELTKADLGIVGEYNVYFRLRGATMVREN